MRCGQISWVISLDTEYASGDSAYPGGTEGSEVEEADGKGKEERGRAVSVSGSGS